MGSDLSMEANNFRPRANMAIWDGDELVIYKDTFYHGFVEAWRGKPNLNDASVVSLIKTMVSKIPEKPTRNEKRQAEAKNMKKICSMLHDMRRGGYYYLGYEVKDIDDMIATAERVYHEMKDAK